jgi:uncharacterized protein YqiB (DUF1249 family)
MQIYERSYRRLRMLAPVLDPEQQVAVAPAPGLPDLHLRIIDRFRYTTVLRLTHFFDEGRELSPLPDVSVRVYHDARLAEAISLRGSPLPSPPYSKWEHNRFLERWLGYCLRQGYRFGGERACAPRTPTLTDVAL